MSRTRQKREAGGTGSGWCGGTVVACDSRVTESVTVGEVEVTGTVTAL